MSDFRIPVAVIDSEPIALVGLEKSLKRLRYDPHLFDDASKALDAIASQFFPLVTTGLMTSPFNGLEVIRKIMELYPYTETSCYEVEGFDQRFYRSGIVVVTAYPTISTAVKALQLGAEDYLAKPFTKGELQGSISRAHRKAIQVPVWDFSFPNLAE